jgi:hypothetical protein
LEARVDAIDISKVVSSGQSTLLLALGIDYSGKIKFRYTSDNDGWDWSQSFTLNALDNSGGELRMKGEPEIVPFDGVKQIPGLGQEAAAAVFVHDQSDQVHVAYLVAATGSSEAPLEPVLPWELTEFTPVRLIDSKGVTSDLIVNAPANSVAGLYMYPHDISPFEVQTQGYEKVLHIFWSSQSQIEVARMESHDTFRLQDTSPIPTDDNRPIAEGSKVAPVMMNTVNGNPQWQQLYVYYLRDDGAVMSSKAYMKETGLPIPNNRIYQVYNWGYLDYDRVRGTFVSVAYDSRFDSQPRLVLAKKILDDDGNPASNHQSIEMRPAPESIAVKPGWGFNDWLTLKYTLCHQVAKGGDGNSGARSKVEELGFRPVRCLAIPEHDETVRD